MMLYVIFHMMIMIIVLTKMALENPEIGISSWHLCKRCIVSSILQAFGQEFVFVWIIQQRECIKAFKIIMHDLAAMMFIAIEEAASIAKTELFHFVSICMTRFNYVQMILLHILSSEHLYILYSCQHHDQKTIISAMKRFFFQKLATDASFK